MLRGDTPKPELAGALFAWHQGFREEGPGTALDKTKTRLAKFIRRVIPRVEKHGWRTMLWQMVGKKPRRCRRRGWACRPRTARA
ncbi:hypothetical protein ACFSUI_23950 [Ralstonia solanacearum]